MPFVRRRGTALGFRPRRGILNGTFVNQPSEMMERRRQRQKLWDAAGVRPTNLKFETGDRRERCCCNSVRTAVSSRVANRDLPRLHVGFALATNSGMAIEENPRENSRDYPVSSWADPATRGRRKRGLCGRPYPR